jgi:hypothetical protein
LNADSGTAREARLQALPLAAVTAVLWAYICSTFEYKIWFIAAAIALVPVAAIAVTGRLRMRGFFLSTLPVLGYFGLLLAGSRGARFPSETVRWVLIDSIEIVIFALSYLAGLNSSGRAIALAITSVVIPTMAMATFEYFRNPFASRLAGYSLALMPLVMAFAWAGTILSRRKWPWVAAMTFVGGFLLINRSRAPLAAALLAVGLSAMAHGKGLRDRLRKLSMALAAMMAMALLLAAIPKTRPLIMTTFVRITQVLPASESGSLGGAAIEGLEQEIRNTRYVAQTWPRGQAGARADIDVLSERLFLENFPAGLGYMNFPRYFDERAALKFSLHNMYMVWLLEGGALVAIYVLVFLVWLLAGMWRSLRGVTSAEDLAYGIAVLISAVTILLIGVVHQMHQSPALWLVLGLGAARCQDRYDRRLNG